MDSLTESQKFYNSFEKIIRNNLDGLYKEKKIRKEEYAEVYANLSGRLISESAKFAIIEKEIEIKDKEIQAADEKVKLIKRQIQGFNDKVIIDLFKSSMSAWAMMFGSGFLVDDNNKPMVPQFINNDEITNLYEFLSKNNDNNPSNNPNSL